ncbi:MAG: hypothetical protein ABL888_16205 [Pirellulaceae bacterium]
MTEQCDAHEAADRAACQWTASLRRLGDRWRYLARHEPMNALDYRRIDDNGLSFELLVDGIPLGELVGARDTAIPYWIIEDDLPYLPPNAENHELETRIVTVCSCGEYGCGHTRCRVIRDGDAVLFCDFDIDCAAEGRLRHFAFPRTNYDNIVGQIVRDASAYRESISRENAK